MHRRSLAAPLPLLALLASCASQPADSPADAPPTVERERVVHIETAIVAPDLRAAVEAAREAAEAHGGHVERSALEARDERASLELRVPVEALDDVRAALAALGEVRWERESSEDVTLVHADLEARLRAARAEEERMLALLGDRTASLADVLAVERELARVRANVEQLDAERRALVDRVSLARVSLQLEAASTPYWETPAQTALSALSRGAAVAWVLLVSLVTVLAALAPALALVGAMVLAARAFVRVARR